LRSNYDRGDERVVFIDKTKILEQLDDQELLKK